LIEDCCGWNRKVWADAIEFGLSQFPERLDGKKVLEIGAGRHSALAPIFSLKGAEVWCSYYHLKREDVENGQLKIITEKYQLNYITTIEQSIFKVGDTYDLIVLKSVLGGVCRGNDYVKLRAIVDKLFSENLKENGAILTIDNGEVGLFKPIRTLWGAGRNEWTYFTKEDVMSSLYPYDVLITGFGLLNIGSARFFLGGNYEFVNDIIYYIDKVITYLATTQHAVLSIIIRK
jgi:hypothetical protein